MKKVILIAVLLLCSQGFAIKVKDSIQSQKLQEYRSFNISIPESYERNKNKEYVLLIVLDGDYLFEPFSGTINYGAYFDLFPETIVVGVHQEQNEKRLDDSNYDPDSGLPNGKGAQFFEFIGGELLPHIEKKYRIAPLRIIAGHDVTAGFLNFFLYKKDPLFNGYISLSPELAPGMEIRVAEKLQTVDRNIFYYQSVSTEDIDQIRHNVKILDQNIKNAPNPHVHYKLEEISNSTHYSEVLSSIPSALQYFFRVYQPINSEEYQKNIENLKEGHVEYLKNRYENMFKMYGFKTPMRYNDFKAIEVAILKNQAYAELEDLSDVAKKQFPKTLLAKYELALMYEKLGNAKKAVKLYRDASDLGMIAEHTKQKMLDKSDEMKTKLHK